jgi:hypothetical protein
VDLKYPEVARTVRPKIRRIRPVSLLGTFKQRNVIDTVAYWLNARIVEPAGTAVARELL